MRWEGSGGLVAHNGDGFDILRIGIGIGIGIVCYNYRSRANCLI